MLLVLLSQSVSGHEHHTDNIPEGAAISADPIVRTLNDSFDAIDYMKEHELIDVVGLYFMDSHTNPGSVMGNTLSYRNGSRGERCPLWKCDKLGRSFD